MNNSEIAAMWIVAFVLIGGIGVQSALPDLPRRLGAGVEAPMPRVVFTEPGVAGPVVPANERAPLLLASEPAEDLPHAATLAGMLQDVAKRMLGC